MNVHVGRRARFSAAHSYENVPPEVAAPRGVHGHNYIVDVTCSGPVNDRHGMVVNISEIDALLRDIIGPLDGSFLEKDHPHAAWGLPTTENLARWIWHRCKGQIPGVKLESVEVAENDFLWAQYGGEPDMSAYVTRAYEFAAAHRLHSDVLTEAENLAIFGKCNNPNGHGHNYRLEVTVKGPVNEQTGMSCDITRLDEVVCRNVVERLDHKHLNLDVPEFRGIVPTSENIAVVVWRLLADDLGESLYRVRIGETERNYFEYFGEN